MVLLKSDHLFDWKARMQLANVYIKQGLFDDATANYNSIVSKNSFVFLFDNASTSNWNFWMFKLNTDKSNSDAIERLGLINTIIQDVERATTHEAHKDYQAAIDLYTKILEVSWQPLCLTTIAVFLNRFSPCCSHRHGQWKCTNVVPNATLTYTTIRKP